MISISDNSSDMYSYGVPETKDHPRTLYTTILDAKRGLDYFSKKFDTFIPVAYGQAYPFEGITFEQELQRSGSALYGWGVLNGEEEGDQMKVSISLLRFRII